MPNQFFWHELITTDTRAAQKFYGDVVGWTAQEAGVPGHDYTVFNTHGRGVGGMLRITEEMAGHGARPAWLGYIAVDDVDAMAARIKREGGTILREPFEVPGVIRFALAADPQGAVFYVAKPLPTDAPAALPIGTPGTTGWNELMTTDWQSAFAFYEKLFGWTKDQAMDMGPMGTYQLFAAGGPAVGGIMNKPAAIPVSFWGYYFNVPAINAGTERIKAGGGKILNGPMQVPGGQWVVQAMDPQGAAFNLVAPQR
jgi:predicted enzyme related to lactoylglutathione lyase